MHFVTSIAMSQLITDYLAKIHYYKYCAQMPELLQIIRGAKRKVPNDLHERRAIELVQLTQVFAFEFRH